MRGHDPEAELSETSASELSLATLGELAAPSLFSSIRCVVVRGLENLPDESVDGLLGYAAAPAEDVALVLVHGGGPKGSGVLNKLRKLGPVTESKSGELKASEFPSFVAAEVRSHGSTIDKEAAAMLVQAVGPGPALAGRRGRPADQRLPGPVPEHREGQAVLRRPGRGEVLRRRRRRLLGPPRGRRWRSCAGPWTPAPRRCWSPRRSPGEPAGVARYRSAPRGMRDADLAREVGVPPWKLRTIRDQSRGWSDAGIARAIRAVARADADIKGAASDASYTLERLVLTITGLRDQR